MAARTWTCQRVSNGAKCGAQNPKIKLKCQTCGKKRPPSKRPAHMAALDLPYEEYVRLNGGNFCGICGKEPPEGKKLHRDHEHKADGSARGLLCFRCNAALRAYMTVEWLRKALAYLERYEARKVTTDVGRAAAGESSHAELRVPRRSAPSVQPRFL